MINVLSLKILEVFLISDLSWREQTAATCGEIFRKLCVLKRFGTARHKNTRALFVKPDFEYYIPVW